MIKKTIVIVNPVTQPSKTRFEEPEILLAPESRRLGNVASGEKDTDGVNVKQIKEVLAQLAENEALQNASIVNLIAGVISNLGLPVGMRKGEIIVFNGSSWVIKAAGVDGTVLTTDSTTSDGLIWKRINGYCPQGW